MSTTEPSTLDAGEPPRPAPHHDGNEYPLLDMPFTATIAGRRHSGEALSLVEARVSGLIDRSLDGAEQLVRLTFDFPGFELTLTPSARISVEDNSHVALYFTDPAGAHHAQLRKVLNDYISGDLTSADGIIRSGSLAQGPKSKTPPPPRSAMQRMRAGLAGVSVIALTVGLVALAAVLVQNRLFTSEIAQPGRIVPQGETLRATADGQISYLDMAAGEGEVLYAVDTTGGETLSVAMPCDCAATPVSVREGSTVLAGEPIVALSEAGSTPVIEAQLPQGLLFDIQSSGIVDVRLPGGQSFEARLADTFRVPGAGEAGDSVRAVLIPEIELTEQALGQVASLSVSRDAAAPLRPVLAAAGTAGREGARLVTATRDQSARLWQERVAPLFNDNETQMGEDQ